MMKNDASSGGFVFQVASSMNPGSLIVHASSASNSSPLLGNVIQIPDITRITAIYTSWGRVITTSQSQSRLYSYIEPRPWDHAHFEIPSKAT